jgi:hypothetical protein
LNSAGINNYCRVREEDGPSQPPKQKRKKTCGKKQPIKKQSIKKKKIPIKKKIKKAASTPEAKVVKSLKSQLSVE